MLTIIISMICYQTIEKVKCLDIGPILFHCKHHCGWLLRRCYAVISVFWGIANFFKSQEPTKNK